MTCKHRFGHACRVARVAGAFLSLPARDEAAGGGGQEMEPQRAALVLVLLNLVGAEPALPLWQQQLYLETLTGFSGLDDKAKRFRLLHLAGGGGVPREGGGSGSVLVVWVSTLERIVRRHLGPLFEGGSGAGVVAARAAVEGLGSAGSDWGGVGGGITQLGLRGSPGGEAPVGAASDSMCLGLAIYALCHVGEAIGELTGIPGDCDASSLTLAGRPRCDADVMMCNVEVPCTTHHPARARACLQLTVFCLGCSRVCVLVRTQACMQAHLHVFIYFLCTFIPLHKPVDIKTVVVSATACCCPAARRFSPRMIQVVRGMLDSTWQPLLASMQQVGSKPRTQARMGSARQAGAALTP